MTKSENVTKNQKFSHEVKNSPYKSQPPTQHEDGHTVQVATLLSTNVANIVHIKVANMVHN